MSHSDEISRRDLLGRSALALGLLMGSTAGLHAEELVPDEESLPQDPAGPPVTVAVIGLGDQGRALLSSLSYVSGVTVATICDTYEGTFKRALELAPKAKTATDYKAVLADKSVQGVFIATPTHLHKQIVLDALAAGKHVYCEAPLAHTVEDAKNNRAGGEGRGVEEYLSGEPAVSDQPAAPSRPQVHSDWRAFQYRAGQSVLA